MDWVIRYSASTRGDLPDEQLDALDAELEDAAGRIPGRLVREPGKLDGVLFAGSLSPAGQSTHTDVQELIGFLRKVEADFGDLSVRVEDNLALVRRDPVSGELGLDLDGGELLRAVPAPSDYSERGVIELEDLGGSAIVGELQTMIDALSASELDDEDSVYAGSDPTIVPFADFAPLVELASPQELRVIEPQSGELWQVTGLTARRRIDHRSGVAAVHVTGELELGPGLRAHLIAVDIVLRDAAGAVVATEDCFAGYDVRNRCELEAEAMLSSDRATEVASVEVGVDAYLRRDAKLATGRPDGSTLVEPHPEWPVQVSIRRTTWPDIGWTACGELSNQSRRFLATISLSLAVYDGDQTVVGDDETDVTMVAPGDQRAFELVALMDEDEEPKTAVLRGRFVTRSREIACKATLAE